MFFLIGLNLGFFSIKVLLREVIKETAVQHLKRKKKKNGKCLFSPETLQRSESVKVAQSCPTLCKPVDCNPPGKAEDVQGLLQARTLEWVAISFSRGSS